MFFDDLNMRKCSKNEERLSKFLNSKNQKLQKQKHVCL